MPISMFSFSLPCFSYICIVDQGHGKKTWRRTQRQAAKYSVHRQRVVASIYLEIYGYFEGVALLQGYRAVDLPGRTQSKEPCLSLPANKYGSKQKQTEQAEASKPEQQGQTEYVESILPRALSRTGRLS